MFTNDYTHITETNTVKQKNAWFKYLKAFYNVAQIWTKLDWPTKYLQSDYDFKL